MKALKHLPEEPQLYFNLANVYGKKGIFEESEKHFLKAIKLNPNTPKFYANFGKQLFLWSEKMAKKANQKLLLDIWFSLKIGLADEPCHEKTCLYHKGTTKAQAFAQSDQRLCCSLPG